MFEVLDDMSGSGVCVQVTVKLNDLDAGTDMSWRLGDHRGDSLMSAGDLHIHTAGDLSARAVHRPYTTYL